MKTLHALASEIATLQKQARELGLFANDRELLDCATCGLLEDVAFGGYLITYRSAGSNEDTGLRFEELADGSFRCPACRAIVNASATLVPP